MTKGYELEPNLPQLIHRRTFALGTLGSSLAWAVPAFGEELESQGCGVIERILVEARAQAQDAGTWALTVNPADLAKAAADVQRLKDEIDSLSGVVEGNRRKQLLDYVDAVGGALIFFGALAAPVPFLVGGLAFSGTMLIVRGLAGPQSPTDKEVLTNIGGSRVPMVIGEFSKGLEDASVISQKAAGYGRLGGVVVSGAFVAYSFYSFAQSTQAFQASTVELQKLRQELDAVSSALAEMQNQQDLQEMRRACAQAVVDELGGMCIVQPT